VTKPAAPRIAERERFETVAIPNPCKIGQRAATKDGACVPRTSSASFMCDFTELDECKAQCEKGDAKSCWNVAAFIVDRGLNPIKADPRAEAFIWLSKSCAQGYAHACGNAGEALRHGVAVEKDVKRGMAMLTKACTTGDPLSCMVVALAEWRGDGMPVDAKSAREHYERACTLSHRRGCAEAANMAEQGQGGPRDIPGAIRLYERACSETTEVSCQKGRKLAATEASLGGEGARVVLDDRRLEIGTSPWVTPCKAGLRPDESTSTCVKPDSPRTFVCDASLLEECRRQCDRGSARSCWNAAVHLKTMATKAKADAEALAFFDRACRGGHAPGCTQQGVLTILGSGVPKDREHGLPLVEKGCAAKDAPGCTYLGRFYASGSQGTTVDRRRGAAYYEKACELADKNACTSGAQALATYVEGAYQEPARALRLLEGACKLAPAQDDRTCRAAAALRADGATP
jgi:TPR repeat protein